MKRSESLVRFEQHFTQIALFLGQSGIVKFVERLCKEMLLRIVLDADEYVWRMLAIQ